MEILQKTASRMDFHFTIKTLCTKILFILFSLISIYSLAQKTKEEQEIDSQITEAQNLNRTYKTKIFLKVSSGILQKSQKLNYEKGLVFGNYYIASAFTEIGKHTESIKYIKKAQIYTDYLKSDPVQTSRNYGLLGTNYNYLELFSLSAANYHQAINIIKKANSKDKMSMRNESVYYGNLSIVFERIGEFDSMYHYLKKEKKINDQLDDENIYFNKSASYIAFGNYFLKEKKLDSSKYYYDQAALVLKNRDHPYQVDLFLGLGDFYKVQKKYSEAITYYLQAIKLSKKHEAWELSKSYKGLLNAYEKQGDLQKVGEYRILYNRNNDSLEAAKKIERDFVVNEVIKFEKEQEQEKSKEEFMKIAAIAGVSVLLILIGIFIFIKRKRKELIEEKETIIHQKEEENQDLKQKVNESFDEVIQLAKDNSPEFLTRFKEVYPDVVAKILTINPQLRVTEFTLCAYFYLGFTTKDIALYTFKSVNTIRNRRQSLRSKLNISSDENIDSWFKNL